MAASSFLAICLFALLSVHVVFAWGSDYAPECAKCHYDDDCISRHCYKYKCVFNTHASKEKCFPSLKHECEKCHYDSECKSHTCRKGKCVDGGVWRSRHCFLKKECDHCYKGSECAQGKCIHYLCTDGSKYSLKRCGIAPSPIPKPLKKDCETCKNRYECKSGKCSLSGICGGWHVERYCPKDECAKCHEDHDCKGGRCYWGICSSGYYQSLVRCGFKKECAYCKSSYSCATKLCYHHKCVRSKHDYGKCNYW